MNSSRRAFLRTTATLFAAGTLNSAAIRPAFRYVAASDAIDVFANDRGRWTKVQTVPSRSPTALTAHQNSRFLYAANEIDEHEGLPRGTVEAFTVDLQNGRLTLLTRQPLSLSATMPRSLAVSPNGQHMIVAAFGGGSYNVLPLEPNGALGRVSSIFKEIGSGSHPEHQTSAHPHSLIFDRTGRYLLSTDFGCDRISVFRLAEGGTLKRQGRVQAAPGAGPGPLALDASGFRIYVRNELRASISCYPFQPATGQIGQQIDEMRAQT